MKTGSFYEIKNMRLSEVKENQIVKIGEMVLLKLPNGEFDCALPGCKLKTGKMTMDVNVELATKEEFLNAIDKAEHDSDWYSLLLKDVMIYHTNKIF